MLSEKILGEMKNLIAEINKHNYNYYVLDNPTISDKEYDVLYYKLVELEKQNNFVLPNSPTKKVGAQTLTKFKKHHHKHKLYSLNKVNTLEELNKWAADIKEKNNDAEFVLEMKYDGLTICLTYEDGLLVTGATRGNGTIGEDVTQQVKTIKNVPLSIKYKGRLEVNGECLMSLSNLEEYNKTAEEPLKNARNAAAGALRNLDPSVTAERNLETIFYNINYIKDSSDNKEIGKAASLSKNKIYSITDASIFLRENGFNTGSYFKTFKDIDMLLKEVEILEKTKQTINYLTDGLVIKVNDLKLKEDLGYTEKFPRGDIAYKFMAEEVSTMLNDVIWQVGKTGKITPIASLEPVELAGATIKRATLNNIEDIARKKVKIGSRVFIRRSNEVIPEVLGISEEYAGSKEILPPANCPSCDSLLITVGPNLFCTNKDCPEMNKDKIIHFCTRDAMNIEGVSDQTINSFYNNLNVKKVVDLYYINKENLLTLEKFKDKKADNFLKNIESSKQVNLANFVYALCIPGIGIKGGKMLANRFSTLDNIILANYEELMEIDGIGDIMALNIVNFFNDKDNLKLIKDLQSAGVNVLATENINNFNKNITDKTFVITGTFENFSREELTKIIESYKGKVSSSVSAKTDYLLLGKDAGSKLEKATKLNIKVLSIEEFENLQK